MPSAVFTLPPGAAPASLVAEKSGFNMALFGYPGAGKTDFLSTAQDSALAKDLWIFDLEKGIRTISDRDDIIVWRPGRQPDGRVLKLDDMRQAIRWAATANHPFKTFGVDSVSALMRLAVSETVQRPDQQPSQNEWGQINEKVLSIIRDLKDLSDAKGWNVIFTAHAEEIKDESDGTVYIRMTATPGIVKGIYQIVDTVGYLQVDRTGRTQNRQLILKQTPKVIAKHRQPKNGANQLPLEIANPTMQLLMEHLHGKKTTTPAKPSVVDPNK